MVSAHNVLGKEETRTAQTAQSMGEEMGMVNGDRPVTAAPSADAIIEACARTTEALRHSENTELMVMGERRRLACLEKELLRHAPLIIDDAYLSRSRLEALLRSMKKVHETFYEGLYTHAAACDYSCGSRYVAFVPRAMARLYERMVRDVLDNRRRHNW